MILFIQNISELKIFHRNDTQFSIKKLIFTRFLPIFTDNFCHKQQFNIPITQF